MSSTLKTNPSLDFVRRLETAFLSSDREAFERLLYQRIRTVAFKNCQPKSPVTEDIASLDTENDGLCLSEYKSLLTSIFADFEAFLALKKCKKSAVGKALSTKVPEQQAPKGDAHLAALNALLTAVCPKVRSSCGRFIAAQDEAFLCNDCSIGGSGVLCHACLVASIHARHNYKMLPYRMGYCACGYDEAWTSGVCCRIHGGNDREEGKDLPVSDDDDDGPQVLRSVEKEQRQEMERLQRRLDSLPVHVVKRCTYLLRPLIDSTILVPFELIQSFKPNPSALPLRAGLEDCNIYALAQFFICFLRWLKRLASVVLPLRPLICNAMLGRYVEFASGASGGSSAPASKMALLQPGEMLVKPSLLTVLFDKSHALHLGACQSVVAVVTAILLQEPFYKSVFAIEIIRHFDRLTHVRIYDEIADTSILTSLSCQIFADPKLTSASQEGRFVCVGYAVVFVLTTAAIVPDLAGLDDVTVPLHA